MADYYNDEEDVASLVPKWIWEHTRISLPRLGSVERRDAVGYGDVRCAFDAITAAFVANRSKAPKDSIFSEPV